MKFLKTHKLYGLNLINLFTHLQLKLFQLQKSLIYKMRHVFSAHCLFTNTVALAQAIAGSVFGGDSHYCWDSVTHSYFMVMANHKVKKHTSGIAGSFWVWPEIRPPVPVQSSGGGTAPPGPAGQGAFPGASHQAWQCPLRRRAGKNAVCCWHTGQHCCPTRKQQ